MLTVKIEELEKNIEENTAREAELKKAADQARTLKDEVDILRDAADKVNIRDEFGGGPNLKKIMETVSSIFMITFKFKVAKYEATIESYKKKLEETSDVKRQLKLLEEKNTALVQTNMDLEEDVKKTGNWKPQVSDRYMDIRDKSEHKEYIQSHSITNIFHFFDICRLMCINVKYRSYIPN